MTSPHPSGHAGGGAEGEVPGAAASDGDGHGVRRVADRGSDHRLCPGLGHNRKQTKGPQRSEDAARDFLQRIIEGRLKEIYCSSFGVDLESAIELRVRYYSTDATYLSYITNRGHASKVSSNSEGTYPGATAVGPKVANRG
ncbi:uncharacterized protein LOC125041739 [Penaeus chinensis]|uniref:uncharacterized protein LOC125041739 n=1 Tax=Penaeus chinensis TaxID=139456 RepID=UPI001FB78A5B|nr:uncharacterized protein LOC125041739 [Penaeus chinensis]